MWHLMLFRIKLISLSFHVLSGLMVCWADGVTSYHLTLLLCTKILFSYLLLWTTYHTTVTVIVDFYFFISFVVFYVFFFSPQWEGLNTEIDLIAFGEIFLPKRRRFILSCESWMKTRVMLNLSKWWFCSCIRLHKFTMLVWGCGFLKTNILSIAD